MQETEQNIEVKHDQIVNPPPATGINMKLVVVLVILMILSFSSTAALLGYMYAAKTLPFQTENGLTSTSPTNDQQIPVGSASPIPTTSPQPTLTPNRYGNTYHSSALDFGFYYAATLAGSAEKLEVSEVGDTVYLYAKGQPKESGQSVERFTKDPTLSLEAAIKERFLKNIPSDKCFVTPLQSSQQQITKAIIDYPVPANSDEPFFMFGDECPENYRKTNGMRYFYYDARVPNAFFFFSIGQYGIPAYSNDVNSLWQDTFQAYE